MRILTHYMATHLYDEWWVVIEKMSVRMLAEALRGGRIRLQSEHKLMCFLVKS